MFNIDVKNRPNSPRNGLELWFLSMGQDDFARMDEDKPLVHEVNAVLKNRYRIAPSPLDEVMRLGVKFPIVWVN